MATSETQRILDLIKRFNNNEKVCIDKIVEEAKYDSDDNIPNIWLNSENKPVSERTIGRTLKTLKEYFPDSFELIRGGKGEKGCYKAVTIQSFNNFMKPEVLSLMVQTFNMASKSDMFDKFELDDNDRKILESKIKETNKLYEFKNKPLENDRVDLVILKKLEYSIKHQKYINIKYEKKENIFENYEVKPYKILFINENFYVACEIEHEELEFAMYRISKIHNIEDTSKTYHKNIEIEEFIKDIQTPFPRYKRDYKKHLIEVLLEVDSQRAFYFKSKNYLKSQEIISEKENGNLLVKFKITQEREIEELIKRWIPYVKVIEPLSLKQRIEDELKEYLK